MQFLAGFLLSIFNSLLVYLSNRFTKSIGMIIFTVTLLTSLASGLFYFLKSLTLGITSFITNEWVLIGMGMVWPSNAEACVTAILTAELAVYIFRFKKAVYWAAIPK